jgi:hypothetical protein
MERRRNIWILAPNENWIVDRMAREIEPFLAQNGWNVIVLNQAHNVITFNIDPTNINVIWVLADWCWRQIANGHLALACSTVITTVHHIVPNKFVQSDWDARDKITNAYHVFNERTYAQVKSLTSKDVYLVPYWCNSEIWTPLRSSMSSQDIRMSSVLPDEGCYVRSVQHDTEGVTLADSDIKPTRQVLKY